MTIQTIIIEDEEKSAEVISDLIKHRAPDLRLMGTARNVEKSVALIESKAPDLVFLDVKIADGTGFDVLRRLSSRHFEIIFVTAYNTYAVDAFRFAAIDYLLKPLGIADFEQAIERARLRIREKGDHSRVERLLDYMTRSTESGPMISIATLSGFEFFKINDIAWCRSEGTYAVFHFAGRPKVISSRNLGFYEDILVSNDFCRVHHGTIINMRFVKSYIKGKGGYVIMHDGTELEISQRKKAEFLKKYTI